jgi:hypothetical protein
MLRGNHLNNSDRKKNTQQLSDQTNQKKKLQQFKIPIAQNMKPNHKQINLQLRNQQQNGIKNRKARTRRRSPPKSPPLNAGSQYTFHKHLHGS